MEAASPTEGRDTANSRNRDYKMPDEVLEIAVGFGS